VTTGAARYTEERHTVAETELYLLKAGGGSPLLVLHGEEGFEGWLSFHEALSEDATVYAPSHPGYGHTDAPDWISTVPHQAVFYNWFLQEAGIGPVNLVGTGVGGWIAAQMAVMCPDRIRRLVLVGAAGLRPEHEEIFDIFITPWTQVIERSFHDPQKCPEYQRIYGSGPIPEFGGIREAAKTMTIRMCYRPYMYDPALPGMLAKVRVPTLLVWGAEDRIVPVECGQLYGRAIPGALLRTIDQCGHWAHLEKPAELAGVVRKFLSS